MGSNPAHQSPEQERPLESKDWEQIPDFKGLPVQLLINWAGTSTDAFIVFINNRGDVDYKTIGRYDHVIENPQCGAILNQIEMLEAVPIEHLAKQTKIDFRAMLGASLVRALSDDQKNATSLINEAKQFVTARNQELARMWFLKAAICATVVTVIFSALCWVFRSIFTFLMGTDFMSLVTVWAAGSCGALFSVLTRTTNIPLDPAAGRAPHYLEGAARIIAGVIAATFVYLAMTTGVIATKLVAYNLSGEALLCMVAGASERFVRTIIKKVAIVGNDRGEEEK